MSNLKENTQRIANFMINHEGLTDFDIIINSANLLPCTGDEFEELVHITESLKNTDRRLIQATIG